MTQTAKDILTKAGLADTHWGRRIVRAEARGEFALDDRYDAIHWVTCACGKLRAKGINRNSDGEPDDFELYNRGCDFAVNVNGPDFTAAAHTLVAIEKRAREVAGADA